MLRPLQEQLRYREAAEALAKPPASRAPLPSESEPQPGRGESSGPTQRICYEMAEYRVGPEVPPDCF